jgi:translation initiation factor 1
MNKDYKLVYSTDRETNEKCPKCKNLKVECTCAAAPEVQASAVTAKLRMEKKGRGGKAVSVVFNLPPNQDFLDGLCGKLKKACGVGGTSYIEDGSGFIEIQGEKLDRLRELLAKEGLKVRG